eukprot:scaffold2.g7379.t1
MGPCRTSDAATALLLVLLLASGGAARAAGGPPPQPCTNKCTPFSPDSVDPSHANVMGAVERILGGATDLMRARSTGDRGFPYDVGFSAHANALGYMGGGVVGAAFGIIGAFTQGDQQAQMVSHLEADLSKVQDYIVCKVQSIVTDAVYEIEQTMQDEDLTAFEAAVDGILAQLQQNCERDNALNYTAVEPSVRNCVASWQILLPGAPDMAYPPRCMKNTVWDPHHPVACSDSGVNDAVCGVDGLCYGYRDSDAVAMARRWEGLLAAFQNSDSVLSYGKLRRYSDMRSAIAIAKAAMLELSLTYQLARVHYLLDPDRLHGLLLSSSVVANVPLEGWRVSTSDCQHTNSCFSSVCIEACKERVLSFGAELRVQTGCSGGETLLTAPLTCPLRAGDDRSCWIKGSGVWDTCCSAEGRIVAAGGWTQPWVVSADGVPRCADALRSDASLDNCYASSQAFINQTVRDVGVPLLRGKLATALNSTLNVIALLNDMSKPTSLDQSQIGAFFLQMPAFDCTLGSHSAAVRAGTHCAWPDCQWGRCPPGSRAVPGPSMPPPKQEASAARAHASAAPALALGVPKELPREREVGASTIAATYGTVVGAEGYRVACERVAQGAHARARVPPGRVRSRAAGARLAITARGLEPQTSYECSVTAFNTRAIGPTAVLAFTTKAPGTAPRAAAPPKPPSPKAGRAGTQAPPRSPAREAKGPPPPSPALANALAPKPEEASKTGEARSATPPAAHRKAGL